MPFMTSDQETDQTLLLQPQSRHWAAVDSYAFLPAVAAAHL